MVTREGMPDGAQSGRVDGRRDDQGTEDDVRTPRLSSVDLARTALQAARRTARTAGTAPAKRRPPTAREVARLGRTAREPSAIAGILTALADASGWATGTARGALHDTWATIVGEQSARHWKLAGFDAATSTLRILADTRAWATQLRLHQNSVLRRLAQHLPPGALRTLDIRIGRTSGAAAGVGAGEDRDDAPPTRPQGTNALVSSGCSGSRPRWGW